MGGMSEAKTVGLKICDRISKKGLAFIKLNDPELYDEIQKRLRSVRKTARPGSLAPFLE